MEPAVGGCREGECHQRAGDGTDDGIEGAVEGKGHCKGRHTQSCTQEGREGSSRAQINPPAKDTVSATYAWTILPLLAARCPDGGASWG